MLKGKRGRMEHVKGFPRQRVKRILEGFQKPQVQGEVHKHDEEEEERGVELLECL